jgi:hypothetical protein
MRRLSFLHERSSEPASGSAEALHREVENTKKAIEACLQGEGWDSMQAHTGADIDAPGYAVEMHFKRRGSKIGAISVIYKPNLSW